MIRYYKVNMAGVYHIENDIPCQDSYYIKRGLNEVVYGSVADGLGIARHSDVGSRIASQESCEYCMEHYKTGMSFSEVKKIMNNAFVYAYKEVLKRAQDEGNPVDEYDTTLCLVIFDNGHVFYGQSGDSGVIALMKSGEYMPLTVQQRDKDGYVFPLCSGPDMWVFGEVEEPVSSLMLMTDGVWEQICHPLLRNHDVKVNVSLASKFMDRDETSLKSVKKLEKAANRYLKNYPSRLLDDDKTIVVIFNPLDTAKKMPTEYYKAPDWVSLQKAAQANLYGNQDGINQTKDGLIRTLDGNASEKVKESISEDKEGTIACYEIKEEYIQGSKSEPNTENSINNETRDYRTRSPCGKLKKTIKAKKRYLSRQNINSSLSKIYDLIFVLALVGFSIAAFTMGDFVKEHASATYVSVFLISFMANSTILLPAPSILIVLQYSMLLNPMVVGVCGAMGASLGEMVGFLIGVYSRSLMDSNLIKKIDKCFSNYPYFFVFTFSALPIPLFDIVGMVAGVIRLDKLKFYMICFMGKLLKMFVFIWMGQIIVNYVS